MDRQRIGIPSNGYEGVSPIARLAVVEYNTTIVFITGPTRKQLRFSYGMGYAEAFIEWAVYTAVPATLFPGKRLKKLVDYYLEDLQDSCFWKHIPIQARKT